MGLSLMGIASTQLILMLHLLVVHSENGRLTKTRSWSKMVLSMAHPCVNMPCEDTLVLTSNRKTIWIKWLSHSYTSSTWSMQGARSTADCRGMSPNRANGDVIPNLQGRVALINMPTTELNS